MVQMDENYDVSENLEGSHGTGVLIP